MRSTCFFSPQHRLRLSHTALFFSRPRCLASPPAFRPFRPGAFGAPSPHHTTSRYEPDLPLPSAMATLAAQAAHPIRLDYSAVDYATAFVKEELKPLTARFDETLEKTFMPRIRAVLREVEQERRAYLEAREDRLVVLRQKLHSFGVDKTTADTLLGRICHFPPELLGLLPTESLLGDFVLSRAIAGDGFLAKSPNLSVDSAYAGSPASVEKPNHFLSVVTNVDPRPATYRPEPTDDRRISTRRRSQQQQKTNAPAGPAVDSPTTARSRKRYNDGEIDDAPGPSKRLRNLESEVGLGVHRPTALAKQTQVPSPKGTQGPPFRRALRPADIQPQERIFRHFDREGYFVVRCDRPDCLHRYFTEQPFGYSRAYRHFVKQHNDTGLENSRISDEEIFDRYAHEGRLRPIVDLFSAC